MHFWGECSIHTVMKKIKYYPRRWGERVDYTYPIQRVLTWGSFGTACFCTHTSKGFAAAQCRWTITPHDAELTVKTIRAPSGAIDPHCTSLARFKRWSTFYFANGKISIAYTAYMCTQVQRTKWSILIKHVADGNISELFECQFRINSNYALIMTFIYWNDACMIWILSTHQFLKAIIQKWNYVTNWTYVVVMDQIYYDQWSLLDTFLQFVISISL